MELKNWLDLRGNRHDKATLAKAAMALANHGGGSILLGFEDGPDGVMEAGNRTARCGARFPRGHYSLGKSCWVGG